MGAISIYRLRLERELWKLRARRARCQLRSAADRTVQIRPRRASGLCLPAQRGGAASLFPDLLPSAWHRPLRDHRYRVRRRVAGIVAGPADVSLWTTGASYRQAHFGIDWLNGLLSRCGHGHWALTVDVDAFPVYPHCDTRPLRALTDGFDCARGPVLRGDAGRHLSEGADRRRARSRRAGPVRDRLLVRQRQLQIPEGLHLSQSVDSGRPARPR